MNITVHSNGCRSLVEYLTLEQTETSLNGRRRLLTQLFEEPDFSKWLEAYSSFIPDVRRSMFDLMLKLDEPSLTKAPSVSSKDNVLDFLGCVKRVESV